MMRKLFSFEQKKDEGYNVDFSDLHIINICNEEKEQQRLINWSINLYLEWYRYVHNFVARSNVKKNRKLEIIFKEFFFPYSNWSVFYVHTKFKLPIILCHFFLFLLRQSNECTHLMKEKRRKKMCVKCQLSALFLRLSLYVAANERNPTCHNRE